MRHRSFGKRGRVGRVTAALSAGVLTHGAAHVSTAQSLYIRGDGTYENAIAWQFEGAAQPDYGAIAVRFPEALDLIVESLVLDLTRDEVGARDSTGARVAAEPGGVGSRARACSGGIAGSKRASVADLYIWDEIDGIPGAVLRVEPSASIEVDTAWPEFTRATIPLATRLRCEEITGAAVWAGFWGHWPNDLAGWFVGVDLDAFGPGGMTRIAPGLGYPSGWQPISVAWGPVSAVGIGILAVPCDPEPVVEGSWGRIKQLFSPQGDDP